MMSAQIPNSGDEPVGFQVPDKKNLDNGTRVKNVIVSLAAGSSPTSSLSLTSSIQTMTGYIVEIATGDAAFGSDIYYSIYAVGFTLFIFTLIMNLLSQWISKRFREEY